MNLGMKVLASCLLSREAFNSLYENVDFKGLSPDIEWLLNLAEKYYETDEEAKAVDHNLFKEQVESKFPNTGKAQHLLDMIDEAYSATFSVPNYVELYLETKRKAIGFKLAGLLSSSEVEEEVVESLMSDYKKLAEPITEGTEDDNVIHNMSVEDAINKVFDKTGRIYLAPKGLQDATDGAMAGDSIIIFARPECGKTAFCCTLMAGFAWYNVPGIFFSNEEPTERVAARFQSTVTDMTAEEIKAEPEKATAIMARRGYEHVRFIRLQFSTPAEIEKYVKMYGAKWFIVDQLRNMHIPRLEGKTQVLEESAKALREIAARHGAISIGVTQAGDSAEGKARLVQGDVDGSNTGIPGACDLMIGIGMTLDMEQQNTRMISLPKNKLSGRHVHFPLRIKPFVSRMENI